MQPKRVLGPIAGVGAAIILAGAAWAAATQSASPPPPDAMAHHGPPDGPGFMMPGLMPPGALEHLAGRLGLTAEQHQTIQGLYEQAKPGFDELRKRMHANAELLAKTRPDDSAYQSVVANVSQSAGEIARQMVLQGTQLHAQVFGVLTPEQKTRLISLQAEMRARWQEHGPGHGHHRGPPPGADAPPGGG